MIIDCVNCNKKFEVNSELIPTDGRTIQCGSCNHVWFFKKIKNHEIKVKKSDSIQDKSKLIKKNIIKSSENVDKSLKKNTGYEVIKYKSKSNFTFSKFLSYIIVSIISFIALIIVLDTFKNPLYNLFPNLEIFLFSLFETLKDISLFIKDLF